MIATICGIPIYYEIIGRGVPVINLHGNGVDHRSIKVGLEPVFQGEQGFQRIYFDLPGMGASGTSPQILGPDDMLELVMQFIDHLLPKDQPFVLTGYSYGGYLARGVLGHMKERVSALLMICPVIGVRRQDRTLPRFRLCERDEEFFCGLSASAQSAMDQFITIQTRSVWQQYSTAIHPALSLADPDLMDRIRDKEFSFGVDRPEACFDQPVLILAGRYDVAVGYQDAAGILDNFSRADFIVMERSGHLLHMEEPGIFQAHVRAWLDKITG